MTVSSRASYFLQRCQPAPVSLCDTVGVDGMLRGLMMGSDQASAPAVEFETADIDDLDVLYNELRGTPGVEIEAMQAPPVPGEQGATLDFLTVACSGGAITAALELVRSVVESRGSNFSLKVRRGKDRIEINATNVDEMLPVLKELLGGP